MHNRLVLLLLFTIIVMSVPLAPALAQEPDGYTTYMLNLRAGPDTSHDVVTVLDGNTGLYFEGRTADLAWFLVRTEGSSRGWVAALYVVLRDGYGSPANLPVSNEMISVQAAPPPPDPAAAPSGAVDKPAAQPAGEASVSGLEIDAAAANMLASTPVVPTIGGRVQAIFQRGQQLGNRATVFTQVGECNIQSQAFMVPFGSGAYDLGSYGHLQAAIDFFQTPVGGVSNSFWYKGVAMTTGLTSAAVVDPAFGGNGCPAGQSLLECEYDRSKPAVALIHLGLYDVYWLTPGHFEQSMRRIVEISIDRGVIPVLTTFPTHSGDDANWPNTAAARYQNRAAFNRTIVKLSYEYGIPVINLWRATQAMNWHGLKPHDYQHLLEPPHAGFFTAFNGEEHQYGFTMWNLVALQTLEALRTSVLGG